MKSTINHSEVYNSVAFRPFTRTITSICHRCPTFWHLWATLEEGSCLGPHIKYIVTHNHQKKNLIMFQVNLGFCVGPHSRPSWAACGPRATGWTRLSSKALPSSQKEMLFPLSSHSPCPLAQALAAPRFLSVSAALLFIFTGPICPTSTCVLFISVHLSFPFSCWLVTL